MELSEWIDRAEVEQSGSLHKFNFERERSYGCSHLDASHQAFTRFLSGIDAATDHRSADAILSEFYSRQSHSPRPLDEGAGDARFLPPGLRVGPRQVFLRHLGIDYSYLRRIGFKDADIRKAEDGIAALVRASAGVVAGVEEELQEIAASTMPRRVSPIAVQLAYRGPAPGGSVVVAPADTYGDEPWWFTFEDDLEIEERSLPARADALERSGYVAGVRSILGLHHNGDAATDAEVAASGTFRFRMLFQLATRIPAPAGRALRQPGMFSGGIPYLFVSNPRSDGGGRTVRLLDRSCAGAHSACRCGRDGLPEGVVPGYVVMTQADTREVRGIYLVLHRDLERYEVPSCDFIRGIRAP